VTSELIPLKAFSNAGIKSAEALSNAGIKSAQVLSSAIVTASEASWKHNLPNRTFLIQLCFQQLSG
jgi:hypothetical protein